MKGSRHIRELIAVAIVGISVALIYGAACMAQATDAKLDSPTCSSKLRKAMDDMHVATHMFESSGDVDEDFVHLMLPHHQAAIEMAKIELLCGKDPANRRLAQEIIADQQSEIELMNLWLSKRSPGNTKSPIEHHKTEEKP